MKTLPHIPDEDPRHGKPSSYSNLSCRCDRCREAWAAYARERRQAKQVAA